MAWQDYQIAAGANNAAGLVNIESIVPSSSIALPPPVARGVWNPGETKVRGDGKGYLSGYAAQPWYLGTLLFAQYAYFKTTYCAGGYSGAVTVRTRHVTATYANYNAILTVPKEFELETSGYSYFDVTLTFTRLVAL